MDTLFIFLKKSLVGTMFALFAFMAVYVPQDWNKVEIAHAGGALDISTEHTQTLNNIELVFLNGIEYVNQGFNFITSKMTSGLFAKEFTLDGVAWWFAKQLVSNMVQSLINWINSGFKGSPMFVQDLRGFLLDTADQAMGEYLQDLGGIGSFICEPFRLDVRIAIDLQYQRSRIKQPAPTCSLSGIIDNIEGFLSGAQGSFSEGGWEDWFEITSSPEVYTPYGAVLSAERGARARILDAQGQELAYLQFGDGFLSGEICEMVHGAGTTRENCFISKPGKVISEALNNHLDSGRESLITADEIDEIIGALLGQLANTALTGAAGLLGLSSGTGYTYGGYSGGSYLNSLNDPEPTEATPDNVVQLATAARSMNQAYVNTAQGYITELLNISVDPARPVAEQEAAAAAAQQITQEVGPYRNAIIVLGNIITDMNSGSLTPAQEEMVAEQYNRMVANGEIATQEGLVTATTEWIRMTSKFDAATNIVDTRKTGTGSEDTSSSNNDDDTQDNTSNDSAGG